MPRVLLLSPHFPPDTSAGTHRVRLLAPHLVRYGWEPTLVSVDPRDYESRLDKGLDDLVQPDLRVVRCRALPARWSRRVGIGDLGLRAFYGLLRTCSELLQNEPFDVLFITIYPSYPALLGPILKRKFMVPFVLDYQDPWVGSWGKTVGGGKNGKPNIKNRLARAIATQLEPRAASAADAITAVSCGTYEEIQERYPELKQTPCMAIPLGGEIADFDYLRSHPRINGYFNQHDGRCHICYVGTLLPMGFETLRALLKAVARLRQHRPELYDLLRLHFFGTSNQTSIDAPMRVLPIAQELGVSDCVTEVAPRIDYLDALTVQTQATVILMMGSSEKHYTASKLYPGLLSKRPIFAMYHEESSVIEILSRATRRPTVRVITYNDTQRAENRLEAIYTELADIIENQHYNVEDIDFEAMSEFSAEALAGKLAAVFEQVKER